MRVGVAKEGKGEGLGWEGGKEKDNEMERDGGNRGEGERGRSNPPAKMLAMALDVNYKSDRERK